MKFEDQVVDLIAAIGARAAKVPDLEKDKELWQRWYEEEREKVRKVEEKVSKLREQLRDAGLDPVA